MTEECAGVAKYLDDMVDLKCANQNASMVVLLVPLEKHGEGRCHGCCYTELHLPE